MSGPPPLASEADRAALAEVLARPEFRDRQLDGLALRRWLGDLWDRLVEALGTAEAEKYASLGRLIYFLALAAALLLTWRALRRRRARRAGLTPGAAVPAPTARHRPAGPSAGSAAAALEAGDLRAAVRGAFAAAAAALGRRWPGAAEALTGAELSARAGDPGFTALAVLHDRAVFGRRPPALEEARAAVEVARRLEVGPGPRP